MWPSPDAALSRGGVRSEARGTTRYSRASAFTSIVFATRWAACSLSNRVAAASRLAHLAAGWPDSSRYRSSRKYQDLRPSLSRTSIPHAVWGRAGLEVLLSLPMHAVWAGARRSSLGHTVPALIIRRDSTTWPRSQHPQSCRSARHAPRVQVAGRTSPRLRRSRFTAARRLVRQGTSRTSMLGSSGTRSDAHCSSSRSRADWSGCSGRRGSNVLPQAGWTHAA